MWVKASDIKVGDTVKAHGYDWLVNNIIRDDEYMHGPRVVLKADCVSPAPGLSSIYTKDMSLGHLASCNVWRV